VQFRPSDEVPGVALEQTLSADCGHDLADSRYEREHRDQREEYERTVTWSREHHDSEQNEAKPPRTTSALSVPSTGR
jgi:hypothetical protein